MAKLKPLSPAENQSVVTELAQISERVVAVANIIGPAYGAKWCDKAVKIRRMLLKLEMQVRDKQPRGGER